MISCSGKTILGKIHYAAMKAIMHKLGPIKYVQTSADILQGRSLRPALTFLNIM